MSDRLLKESDVLRIAFQLPLVVNSAFANAVKALPSAKRPQGEWIRISGDWIDGPCGARYFPIRCSVCGYSTYDDDATNYCPNCGVRMKGADDE